MHTACHVTLLLPQPFPLLGERKENILSLLWTFWTFSTFWTGKGRRDAIFKYPLPSRSWKTKLIFLQFLYLAIRDSPSLFETTLFINCWRPLPLTTSHSMLSPHYPLPVFHPIPFFSQTWLTKLVEICLCSSNPQRKKNERWGVCFPSAFILFSSPSSGVRKFWSSGVLKFWNFLQGWRCVTLHSYSVVTRNRGNKQKGEFKYTPSTSLIEWSTRLPMPWGEREILIFHL